MAKVILCFSGGLDATVLLWELRTRGLVVECLTVDYGQEARAELIAAGELCRRAGAEQHLVQIPNLRLQLGASHVGFSARRGMFLSLALALAAARDAETVALAERIDTALGEWPYAANHLAQISHRGRIGLYMPFVERTKDKITALGRHLKAPLAKTWSCSRGGTEHCGLCRACVQRRRGFVGAEVSDPTDYEEAPETPALPARLRVYAGSDRWDRPDSAA